MYNVEQEKIVQEIESRLSVCDKLEENIEQPLHQAEALRQSILKKAFEGRLLTEAELEEVRKSPDWEPAEKLLEKIRSEKSKTVDKIPVEAKHPAEDLHENSRILPRGASPLLRPYINKHGS